MQNTFLLLLLTATSFYCQAQMTLSGTVIDDENSQPIPYANIGILHTEIGTISNEDGSFSIAIPQRYINRELLFSSIGYEIKSVRIDSIGPANNLRITLDEAVLQLNDVIVQGEREKKKSVRLGNGKSLLLSGQLYYDTISSGSAMALLIDKTDYEYFDFVNEVSLYIAKNKSPEFKIRLRFLGVDSITNKPGEDIINEQIIATSMLTKGWLNFELPQNYQISADVFYVMFEWLLDKDDRAYIANKYAEYMEHYPDRVTYDTVMVDNEKLTIPSVSSVEAGTVFGTTNTKADLKDFVCYYRTNSFGEWKRATGILSAKVSMANYIKQD